MTISTTLRTAGPFVGDDAEVTFPFEFKVFAPGDVAVYRTDSASPPTTQKLYLYVDYTITLEADQNANPGGVVTLLTPLATGYTLVVSSDMSALQPMALTNLGGFYPAVLNDAHDRAIICIQQLQAQLSGATPPDLQTILAALEATFVGQYFGRLQVADAAALRLVDTAVVFGTAFTFGAVSAGDGGGGLWMWDAASTSSDNLGTVIMPTGQVGAGRWVRVFSGPVNVAWFGADGVDRGPSVDSTALITAAMAAGQEVFIPAGIYYVSGLHVPSHTRLFGAGLNSTQLRQISANTPALQLVSPDAGYAGIVIEQLSVKGLGTARQATDAPAVTIEATGANVVKDSRFAFNVYSCSTALELICEPSIGQIYHCTFDIMSETSAATAFIFRGAIYSVFRLFAVNCENGSAISSYANNCFFQHIACDGKIGCSGGFNVLTSPVVETIYADKVVTQAFSIQGRDNTLINPSIVNVQSARAEEGFAVSKRTTIIHPTIIGTDYPAYPFTFLDETDQDGATSTIIGGRVACGYKINAYVAPASIAKLSLLGYTADFYTGGGTALVVTANKSQFFGTDKVTVNATPAAIWTWVDNNEVENESQPAFIMVSGVGAEDSQYMFNDLVLMVSSTVASTRPRLVSVLHSQATSPAEPPARTYTVDATTGSLMLAMDMPSFSYTVRASVIQGYTPYR